MRPSTGHETRCAPRWRNLALGGCLAALAACAPTAPVGAGPTPAAPDAPLVRVGLLVDTAAVEITAPAGFDLVEPTSGIVTMSFEPGQAVVFTADDRGRLRWSRAGASPHQTQGALLRAEPHGEGMISIGGKPYRGDALVRAAGPNRVTAINVLDMETYLLGVVPREIGRVGPELLEAAKAQAVAARTYAVSYMGRREALGFDVFATVQDQVYGGVEAEHDPVSQAVRATAGEILTYEGEPIEAFYHSTCAGQTAAIDEVWPTERPRPYLVSVVDLDPAGQAYDRSSSRFQWTERWTAEQLTEILNRTLADSLPAGASSIGELRDLRVLERTPSGRVRRMAIVTSVDTFYVGGDRVRWILPTPRGPILNSSRFDVAVERDAQGNPVAVVATGGGWGHGIGMCQVGAMGRARAGQDYRTILNTYYPRAELREVY